MPAAMPNWRAALFTPDAIPPWSGGTAASAATVMVGLTRPAPAPNSVSPGSSRSMLSGGPSRIIRASPAAHSSRPQASVARAPKRAATGAAASETKKLATANGAIWSPASTGLDPATVSRYWVM